MTGARVDLHAFERGITPGARQVFSEAELRALVAELRVAREVVDQLPHPGLLNAAGNSSEHNEIRLQFYAASDALATYLRAYDPAVTP
jgi:hypothetical protein